MDSVHESEKKRDYRGGRSERLSHIPPINKVFFLCLNVAA